MNWEGLWLPLVEGHVDVGVVKEGDTVGFEEVDLLVDAAEGKGVRDAAVFGDDPVAGDAIRVRVDVQRIADDARPPRVSRQQSYLTIGGHLAARDLPDDIINQVECAAHGITSDGRGFVWLYYNTGGKKRRRGWERENAGKVGRENAGKVGRENAGKIGRENAWKVGRENSGKAERASVVIGGCGGCHWRLYVLK